jgi:hypothetical protein
MLRDQYCPVSNLSNTLHFRLAPKVIFFRKSQVKSPKSQVMTLTFLKITGKSQSHDFDFFEKTEKVKVMTLTFLKKPKKVKVITLTFFKGRLEKTFRRFF